MVAADRGCGRGSDAQWERAESCERGEERLGPWPTRREPQDPASGAVHEPRGEREQSRANGTRDGELAVGTHVADRNRPAVEVVGEHTTGEPRGVGEEVPGGAVLEPGAVFEVADREFDGRVIAMERIDLDGRCV